MTSENQFFSIIIPAHNEEKYIEATLQAIQSLEYPKDHFQVIVVENASKDATFTVAKNHASENIQVISSSKKGVSAAKNLGVDTINAASNWTIFLDADTILKKNFLHELNSFLLNNKDKNFAVGTSEILPIPDKAMARAWFRFYDIGHRITKASYSIQIIQTELLRTIRFDENVVMGEDIMLIKTALKKGKFFFLPTKSVYTSTRRFDSEGWWKVFFSWTFVAMLPPFLKRRFDYKVVR